MGDLKIKFKAALLTILAFTTIFGLLYIMSKYPEESIAVLLTAIALIAFHTVWKLIYNEITDKE
jgi:hypothetical protein